MFVQKQCDFKGVVWGKAIQTASSAPQKVNSKTKGYLHDCRYPFHLV